MRLTAEFKKVQEHHFLQWNGSIAADLLLLSLNGSESISTPFYYQLRSFTTRDEKTIAALHGQGVSCQIGDRSHNLPIRHVHGIITHIQYERNSDDGAQCIITLEPAFALLRNGKSMRIWQNINVPDLVSKLLGEHLIGPVDIKLHNTYQKREYCMQYRESDADFISRLLEEEGIYYFFRHQEGQHILVLADHPAAHPTAKDAKLSWHHHSVFSLGKINSWSSNTVLIPSEVVLSGYNLQQAAVITEQCPSKQGKQSIELVNYTDITPLDERSLLAGKAKTLMEAYESNTVLYHATVNAYWLSCGEVFKLQGHLTDNGDYRVQTFNINAENNFEGSAGDCQCEIYALRNTVKWRPVCTRKPPDIAGVLTAKVVGPASEEIHTDEYGRIKIQFLWDKENKSDGTSSCWVRVSQPWTGNKFGGQFLPRIGSEVLVSFVQGNPDFPLVIGAVYNGQNKPPFTLPGEKTESGFASRSSSKGSMEDGHRLSFNDKKGEEKITIIAQKDLLRTVKNDLISKVTHQVKSKIGANRDTEITKGNDTLVLKEGSLVFVLNKGNLKQTVTGNMTTSLSNGDYTLTAASGGGKIKTDKACVIESTQSIVLNVGSSKIVILPTGITISSKMIKIEGSGPTSLKGSMTTVEGSGMTKIKGGIINIG